MMRMRMMEVMHLVIIVDAFAVVELFVVMFVVVDRLGDGDMWKRPRRNELPRPLGEYYNDCRMDSFLVWVMVLDFKLIITTPLQVFIFCKSKLIN